MSKYYCLVLTIILVTNTIVHGAIVSNEYTKVHKDVSITDCHGPGGINVLFKSGELSLGLEHRRG